MAQLASATLQRERYAEPHFYIVADELYRYGNEAFKYISRQGRNFNVHLIAAQQDQTDMRPWQRGLMGNASNRVYFQLVPSDALEQAHEFDATPPPGDDEFRPRFRQFSRLETAPEPWYRESIGERDHIFRCLARIADGEDLSPAICNDAARWSMRLIALDETLDSTERDRQILLYFQAITKDDNQVLTKKLVAELSKFYSRVRSARDHSEAFLQQRSIYPETPGTYHKSHSESSLGGETDGESWSSETGPIFDRVPGRPRSYQDVYQQIANELTHLPRQRAKCQLAALDDDPPMEATVKIRQLGSENAEWSQRWESIKERSRREYARPVEEVEDEAKRRDSIMSRAVETWHSQNGDSREYHADGDGLKSANGDPLGRR